MLACLVSSKLISNFIDVMGRFGSVNSMDPVLMLQGIAKEHKDEINRSLLQHRRQIIENRKILGVADLTKDQLGRGGELFSDFLKSFLASAKRDDLDKFVMRDIYFSDECVSYASHMQTILLKLEPRSDSDQESLNAAAYLMNKYQGFKSSIREPDSAVI
jgi:hypothetical protein